MRENFLHYLWEYKKFNTVGLKTSDDEELIVLFSGQHNDNAGPDFLNARIRVGDKIWAGHIEIHKRSSDWYVHGHHKDSNYDNVILHVVWEHDTAVKRMNNTPIPALQLKDVIPQTALTNYKSLFNHASKWINCEQDFALVDDFIKTNWFERLFFERLEQKTTLINTLLISTNNNWEEVLFRLLFKNFGLKVNGEAFFSIATSFDFTIFRKLRSNLILLEALFFGQAKLLNNQMEDHYFMELKKSYAFIKHKFNLDDQKVYDVKFFRLRPSNFPTIRLSQLAQLYYLKSTLFNDLINCKTRDDVHQLFQVSASEFWDDHYTFSKSSRKCKKILTANFIDLLIINTVIPIQFSYERHKGNTRNTDILKMINAVPAEKNKIIVKFKSMGSPSDSALLSQALIQLKSEYCDKNKCLRCAIGNELLNRNM